MAEQPQCRAIDANVAFHWWTSPAPEPGATCQCGQLTKQADDEYEDGDQP